MTRTLRADTPEYVAVYGSLREGLGLPDRPDLGDAVVDRGACAIEGLLYDLGEYPGLVPGYGRVVGELFEIRENAVFQALDEYEHYDALERNESLYIRTSVRLLDPPVDAWVYVYNQSVDDHQLITSGDWAAHRLSIGVA